MLVVYRDGRNLGAEVGMSFVEADAVADVAGGVAILECSTSQHRSCWAGDDVAEMGNLNAISVLVCNVLSSVITHHCLLSGVLYWHRSRRLWKPGN